MLTDPEYFIVSKKVRGTKQSYGFINISESVSHKTTQVVGRFTIYMDDGKKI